MLKREWGAESNGKLPVPHLFVPSKTATLVPEFAAEDLPLCRTAALLPEFAVKDLPLGRTLMMNSLRVFILLNFTYFNCMIYRVFYTLMELIFNPCGEIR